MRRLLSLLFLLALARPLPAQDKTGPVAPVHAGHAGHGAQPRPRRPFQPRGRSAARTAPRLEPTCDRRPPTGRW
ncbi:MAG: hypothetical protein WDM96_05300 [Lacunisphaera sp.]